MMAESDVPDIQIESVGKTVCPRCGMMVDVSDVSAFAQAECTGCGTQFAAPGKLGQYVLLRPIGHSATAVSFKGFDTSMSRHVEVKVLLKELCGDPGSVSAFQAEARALASLDNRSVARAFFVGDHDSRPFCVTELIEGKALSQLISPDKPLSESRTLKAAIDVAGVIRDLADQNMCHRRISPDNVVLVAGGGVKLVNFGGESDVAGDESPEHSGYLAPEQTGGGAVDFNADVYALGATMYFALTGSDPAVGDESDDGAAEEGAASRPDVRSVREGIGQPTADLVARMLRPDPGDRCDSCRALVSELESAFAAAETTRRARGGDVAAALSVLTGSPSQSPSAETPAWARTRASDAKPSGAESSDGDKWFIRRKRLLLYGAGGVAAILLIVLVVVFGFSGGTRGGESFSGNGKHASAPGVGLVVLKRFDLPGWSVKTGAEFNKGALDLFNGIKDDHSLSRRLPVGAFRIRIDLKNMVHGPTKEYDINIRDAPDFHTTFSVRDGVPLVGTHDSENRWQPLARGTATTATTMAWDLTLSTEDGKTRWKIVFQPKDEREQVLELGNENLAHCAHYRKGLKLSVQRTIEIVSVGYGAQMSVDHYELMEKE